MNKVILIGRIVKDPESRTTNTGKKIAKFSLAVNDVRNSKQTYFFNCTAWDMQADYASKYLKKASFIAVDGRLTTSTFVNKEGRNQTVTDITVDSIKSLSTRETLDSVNDYSKEAQDDEIPVPNNFNYSTPKDSKKQETEPGMEWIKDLD
jgi:single-strand DNA-binding protein